MAALKGLIRDSTSGAAVAAKVHVLNSSGNFVHPPDSLMKVGPGDPFFYCDGEFQNSLLCGLSGWVESQVEFPTFNERKKTVGFSFEELIRRKWRNLPSKKSPAYNASLG